MDYKLSVTPRPHINLQRHIFTVVVALFSLSMTGASCDKQPAANTEQAKEVVSAIDKSEGKTTPPPQAAAQATPANEEPIPGVDLSKLDDAKKKRFYQLVDKTLQSPCGKAHSLRTSLTTDAECKRAPFAAKLVVQLLSDEASDSEAQEIYKARYKESQRQTFTLDAAPHSGPQDAPVKVVEFFDYGCPSCKMFAPLLKEAVGAFENEAVVFYKQFPLPNHTHSRSAAQAALAAAKQGKFNEMHDLLFSKAPMHQKENVFEYAKSLGLDMTKFEADYTAAEPQVQADVDEGNRAGVQGTPTTFINGVVYEGPMHPSYIRMWIEEELALNR